MHPDRRPLRAGDPAPAFTLPAVERDGTVSLEDYRGRSALLVGLFRGLHCPFCRRRLVQLGDLQEKLRPLGVETLAVVNTPLDRARLYFGLRPARVRLAADPEAAVHAAFGVPTLDFVEQERDARPPWRITPGQFQANLINPTGEMPAPRPGLEANEILNRQDGFEPTEVDRQIMAAHGTQLSAHFLVGRDGIVRWAQVEAQAGLADLCRFPSDAEIVAAAGGG